MITFTIPGKPIPQERRIHIRGGWAYDPPKSRKAKQVVKLCALAARPGGYLLSELSFIVWLTFYGPHWGADLDNLAKCCVDGMDGVFWKDDHQIVELNLRKIRVPKGQEKTLVEIEELKPEGWGGVNEQH